jgi:hypothetical protein
MSACVVSPEHTQLLSYFDFQVVIYCNTARKADWLAEQLGSRGLSVASMSSRDPALQKAILEVRSLFVLRKGSRVFS